MKKILIDINHPGHVHLYKNFIYEMQKLGHQVWVCVKDIPSAIYLLDKYNIEYFNLGKKRDKLTGKILNQFIYDWKIGTFVNKNKIDYGIGTSINLPHVSSMSRMVSFIFDDDDSRVEPLFSKFAHPFADYIISPDVLRFERNGKKHINYAGYHELAYLHPRRFKPDPSILKKIGIEENSSYFVLRFNAFKAHHDLGVRGLSLENKRKLIEMLNKKGKVFISTERDIESEFARYQLIIGPEKIHSLLYYATLFVGDSQTMTSEAAVLGTPAIRSNSLVDKISYLEEEEHKYELTYGFLPDEIDKMFLKINELLGIPHLKQEWQERRKIMLAEKIDVTSFMVWLIDNYPASVSIMQENPDYQYTFK